MKKLVLTTVIILVISLLTTGFVLAAGSCTVTNKGRQRGLIQYAWDWTSDGSGDCDTGASEAIGGTIVQVRLVPDTGGTAPDDEHNIYLKDANGFDWLFGVGVGAEQSVTDSSNVRTPLTTDGAYPILHSQTLTPTVDSAGDSNGGIIYLLIKE